MNQRYLTHAELDHPGNNGVGSRSEWIDLTSDNHPGDKALQRKDLEGKIIWDRGIPIKMLVRKRKRNEVHCHDK